MAWQRPLQRRGLLVLLLLNDVVVWPRDAELRPSLSARERQLPRSPVSAAIAKANGELSVPLPLSPANHPPR